MKHRYLFPVLAACWMMPQNQGHAQGTDPALKSRVLRDYPPALEKLEGVYSHLRGLLKEEELRIQADSTYDPKKPGPKNLIGIGGSRFPQVLIRKLEYKFALNGKMTRCETHHEMTKQSVKINDIPQWVEVTDPDKKPFDGTLCIGENGGFAFHRDRKTNVPVVKNVTSATDGLSSELESFLFKKVYAPFSLFDRRISSLLKEREFSIDEVTEVVEDGRKLVKIRFAYKVPKGPNVPFLSGWFIVSADEGWVLKRHELANQGFPKARDCMITYRGEASGVPLPETVTIRDPGSTSISKFEDLSEEQIPASEFTLTAFGLPDISKPIAEPTPGGSAKWYYVAAGLAIVFAVALKYYAGRPRSSGTNLPA